MPASTLRASKPVPVAAGMGESGSAMMRHRIFTILFITLFVVGATHFTTGRVAAADQQCFPQTGKCLQGRFLDYWLAHGGLAINGYPITNEQTEKLEDGKDYLVQ